MGEIADKLRGRKIVEADDSKSKLRLTTDHGDIVIVSIDPSRPMVIAERIGKPITDAVQ